MSREIQGFETYFNQFKGKIKKISESNPIDELDLLLSGFDSLIVHKYSPTIAEVLKNLLDMNSKNILPDELLVPLIERDGADKLIDKFSKTDTQKVSDFNNQEGYWNQIGLFYKFSGRLYEAISIFTALYNYILRAQEDNNQRYHKGLPLVWIRECYKELNCPVIAKRYMMLTLIEHVLGTKGKVSPVGGEYFRLIWEGGLTHCELEKYGAEAYEISKKNPRKSFYPEWILLNLDKGWIKEIHSQYESKIYNINKQYANYLMLKIDDRLGYNLEELAEYLLSCIPGFITYRREKTPSTDYDVRCSVEGQYPDFRSELGRYFVCECKSWKKPADFTSMAKFCRVLESTKSKFGILFSSKGISGEGKTKNAEREQLKIFQDRGIIIIVIDKNDLTAVIEKDENFINILRAKYEKISLDLLKN